MKPLFFTLLIPTLIPFGTFAAAAPSPSPTPVRVCIPDTRTEFMTFLMTEARDRGYFEKYGIQYKPKKMEKRGGGRFRRHGAGMRAAKLDNGVATAVAGPEPECVFGSSNVDRFLASSADLRAIKPLMISYYGDEYDTHLVVAKNSPIQKVEELKGANLHVGQLPTFLAVSHLLKSHGLSLDDVKVDSGLEGGPERMAALESGEIKAMTAYLPSMSYLLSVGKVRILEPNVVSRFVGPRIPHSTLIVNADFAKKNPKVVAGFKAAMNEAYAYMMRNPSEFLNIFRRYKAPQSEDFYKMTDAEVEKAATFVGHVPMVDLEKDMASLYCDTQAYGRFIAADGYLEKPMDLADWMGVPADRRNCATSSSDKKL